LAANVSKALERIFIWRGNVINVRSATLNDSKDVFEWRNDELTRLMSHTTNVVQWDEHNKWFDYSLTNEFRLLVICEEIESQEKVAVVRFDIESERGLISINLAPNKRGKGLAKPCLREAILFFKTTFPDVLFINAEIKTVNVPSRCVFEGLGFVFKKQLSDIIFYEYVI
jgi:RimJ/RimL family protein N-acetyltransferase